MANEDSRFVANYKVYADVYHVLSRKRKDYQRLWLEHDLLPKLRDVFIPENSTPKSEFKILAVGTNAGLFDCMLIHALFSHAKELVEGKQVFYTVVEPNAVAIDEFKQNVSSQEAVFQNVKFNWVNTSMQEFLEVSEEKQYDLIQFVHVFYYAENEDEILRTAYEKFLASPGCILTVVVPEANIWVKLLETFKTKIPQMEYTLPTNVEMSEICKRERWAYEMFDARLDLEVTEAFNERDPVGEEILKFFLHVSEEPKKKFGIEMMEEIMEFVRRMSWEKMKDGKKHFLVNEDESILLIYKRS